MMKFFQSKLAGFVAMLLVLALIVIAFVYHTPWWGFIALFFLFLGIFTHLASLYLGKINRVIGKKLDLCALVCICLAIIGFITEYILFQFAF